MFSAAFPVYGQKEESTPGERRGISIDHVVALVNRQIILASDLEDEMQISILDPSRNLTVKETPQQALDRLVSRTLIQQQIRQEEAAANQPTAAEIDDRVQSMRKELPACLRADCQSDAGWKKFLAQHDLSPAAVEDYIRNRIEILRFIEARFRQGIRITPEEVEAYYRGTLLPQYPAGITPPPVEKVSGRIEEILLQQRVNELFSSWLANLRKQGQIEVLDPSLTKAEDKETEAAN